MKSSIFIFILFVHHIPCVESLLSKLIGTPLMSELENIISRKALLSSIFTNVQNEITLEKVAFQISDIHFMNHNIYLFSSCLFIYLYGQLKYLDGMESNKKKEALRKVKKYYYIEKYVKEIIFILIFVFMKDVQSVI